MALETPEVDLAGMRDPQRPVAVGVGLVLVVLGIVSITGVLDMDVLDEGLVLGVFGVPLWLGLTLVVAGALGVYLGSFAGGATTFDKVAATHALPAALFLAVTDYALAVGDTAVLALGVVTLLLAVVIVAVGTFLLRWTPLMLVLPLVAAIALLDWGLDLTAMTTAGSVTLPTIGLLVVLEVVVALIAFEGGRRQTGRQL